MRLLLFVWVSLSLFGQNVGGDVRPDLSGMTRITYPALARQANIRGIVEVRNGENGLSIVSGHPLLKQSVSAALERLPGNLAKEVTITVHFRLTDPESRPTALTEPRGNAVDRFFLRMIGRKTTVVRMINQCVDDQKMAPMNKMEWTTWNRVEVFIFGVRACMQTMAAGEDSSRGDMLPEVEAVPAGKGRLGD